MHLRTFQACESCRAMLRRWIETENGARVIVRGEWIQGKPTESFHDLWRRIESEHATNLTHRTRPATMFEALADMKPETLTVIGPETTVQLTLREIQYRLR